MNCVASKNWFGGMMNQPHQDSTPPPRQDREMAEQNIPPFFRYLLLGTGILCLILSVIAFILPVLPVIPFLLIAAACFMRSSRRFYRWLVEHRIFGAPVRRWRRSPGFTLRSKIAIIASTLLITGGYVIFMIPWLLARIMMIAIAAGMILFVLWAPTVDRKNK
jgi:uncharacterized protein